MGTKSKQTSRQPKRPVIAYFCSHTHWDREWYGTFQEFRMRLVRLVDRLMDLLEDDPDFRCFNLDGQTVVLEDYLEVKPEQRGRLEKLIREGRIAVGPWYILPDEWLVSGEATVRNLLRGRALCREFGAEPATVGYLPDMFGHISQIPQLLRGFGLDNTIMWRGLSGDQWKSELWWDSPDGSRVLAHHLPENVGYCNAAFFYGSLPEEARTLGDSTPYWSMVSSNIEFAAGALGVVLEKLKAPARSNVLLLLNGVDHMEAQPQVPKILKRAAKLYPHVEFRHGTLSEFMDALKKSTPKDLQVIRGEQRSTAMAKGSGEIVLPNILSSRIYLKQANTRCQTLLEKWSEPFCSAAAWVGHEYPAGLLNTGWKWLLRNHPHDSIGGCSTDPVHRQMETRFEWAGEIGEITTGEALYKITQAIKTDDLNANELAFYVFNPLNWVAQDLVTVDLDISAEEWWESTQGITLNRENIHQTVRNLSITEWDGRPVAFEILDIKYMVVHRPWMEVFGPSYQTVRFRVALWAEDLPAMGYRGYRVSLVRKAHRLPNRHGTADIATLSNEHLKAEIQPNGTLRLSGPILGRDVLEGLHYFEDGGDNGDGYTYSPPRHDSIVTSLGGPVQITRLNDEPAIQSVAVDYMLEIPESVTGDRQHRSAVTVSLKVRSVFTLGKKSRRLDVETTLVNAAKDHRLRICFRMKPAGKTHFAETQFDIVERHNAVVQPAEEQWVEDMPLEQSQQSFVAYGPLALANAGLPEYEIVEAPQPVLKLTLLRAVNYLGAGQYPNTIQGGAGPMMETPDQQMLGRSLTFRYSLIPQKGHGVAAETQRQALQHGALWRGVTAYGDDGILPPDKLGFLGVSGANIVMSAVKQVENCPGDFVVRFWNSGSAKSTAQVHWHQKPSAVYMSDLAECLGKRLMVDSKGAVSVPVKPKQIVTLRFVMGREKGGKRG
ncbi:MAG: hypothetical protein K1X53_06140 [Candidatus Sumerlaeaceae bacterium]|nr:hypothetical protein [Candidatus Sumerlaeaceae bacterium]